MEKVVSKDRLPQLAHWLNFQPNIDSRGRLTEIDFRQLPFAPVRAFYVDQVAQNTVRGGHAHSKGSQLFFCLNGKISVELRKGNEKEVVTCFPGSGGLLIDAGIWAQQTYLEKDSVLLVLCSHPYQKSSYLDHSVSD